MGGKESLMRELSDFKKRLGKAIVVSRMILFGSQAEGKAESESDVDLIIVSSAFAKLNFFQRAALMYDYWTVRKPVDFLCYTPKEFEELGKKITIVRHALQHGTAI